MKGKYCIFLVLIFLAAACNITDKKPASPEQLAALAEKTEQYCVVMRTLQEAPRLTTTWSDPHS